MATIDIYSKSQIDAKLPPTTGASNGDVLTFNGTSTVWAAVGEGTPTTISFSTMSDVFTWLSNNTKSIDKNYELSFESNSISYKIILGDWITSAAAAFIAGYGYKNDSSFMYLYVGFRISSNGEISYQTSTPGSYTTWTSYTTSNISLKISA